MSARDEQRRSEIGEDDWERVLRAAAHLQRLVPDAILVGGTASALYAQHRYSYDDDHIVADLVPRFQSVLADLERVAGWTTNRVRPPVLILGNLDGVETGIRNLVRSAPLETRAHQTQFGTIVLPTIHEMLRIKAWLAVTRNATRDYLDSAALADRVERDEGEDGVWKAFEPLDRLYPQTNGTAVTLQAAKQFAEPRPYDADDVNLSVYRGLDERWQRWESVVLATQRYAEIILRHYVQSKRAPEEETGRKRHA